MKKILSLFVLLFVVIFLHGCASIVSKSDYPVSISSNPLGAEIFIRNRAGQNVFSGKTPTTVTLKAGAGYFTGENYNVVFKKKGYATHGAQIARGIDGWYIAGNFLIGGLIGWFIVDPLSGAMWTLSNLHVDLAISNPISENKNKDKIQIVELKDVPIHLQHLMVRIN